MEVETRGFGVGGGIDGPLRILSGRTGHVADPLFLL